MIKPQKKIEEKKNNIHSQITLNKHKLPETRKNLVNELTPDNWVNYARDFDANGLLRQFFQQATLLEINNKEDVILKFLVPMPVLNENSLTKRVQSFLSETFKIKNLKVEVEVGNSHKKNLAEVELEILNLKKDDSEKKIMEYSLTKKIIKHFDAKIVRDSIETKENET